MAPFSNLQYYLCSLGATTRISDKTTNTAAAARYCYGLVDGVVCVPIGRKSWKYLNNQQKREIESALERAKAAAAQRMERAKEFAAVSEFPDVAAMTDEQLAEALGWDMCRRIMGDGLAINSDSFKNYILKMLPIYRGRAGKGYQYLSDSLAAEIERRSGGLIRGW